jgi:hypothetical protein
VLLKEESAAREQIADWTARTRARKVELFGTEAIDSRCTALRAPKSASGKSRAESN